jgi:predicted esterase
MRSQYAFIARAGYAVIGRPVDPPRAAGSSSYGGRGMQRLRATLTALVAALAGGVVASPAAGAVWPAFTGTPSGVFRTGTYDRGEWIFTNGLHQALGANTDGLHRTDYFRDLAVPGDPTGDTNDIAQVLTYNFFGVGRAARNGDYQLPTDPQRWPDGTADLAEVRLAIDGDALIVRFLWNAMPRKDAQIATLTFATADAYTPPRAWPRGANLTSRWQVALTHWGTGAALVSADGVARGVDVHTGDHVTEARIPLSALPPGPWKLTGGAGLDDPASPGHYWTVPVGLASADRPGGGVAAPTNVWTLLFSDDDPWTFDELHQGDELAAGIAGHATATVDPALLRSRATRAPDMRTGDLSRMFTSRLADGDGIDKVPGLDGVATAPPELAAIAPHTGGFETWQYHGRLQDYAMRVPSRYATSSAKWPLIVYLHGFGGNPDEAFYLPLGLAARADREGYLLASARGRGDHFYTGAGDLDVMEVLRDVEAHYRVDRNRVYLMGHSMGGYGTNNVATHHPDLFAAVAPAQGTASEDLHGNLRNVPWFEISSDEDLDFMAQSATALYETLSADGADATLLVYHMKIHEYSSIYDTLDQLFPFFAAHRRTRDPAVISWTKRPGDDDARLGLSYDGAYWLHGVTAADASKSATVTATSGAISHRVRDPKAAKRTHDTVNTGGPSGRTMAELYRTVPETGTPAQRTNTLTLVARNVAGLRVNASRARLKLKRGALRVTVDADRPVLISLTGLARRRVRLRIDGGHSKRMRLRHGRITRTLPAGKHSLSLRRS